MKHSIYKAQTQRAPNCRWLTQALYTTKESAESCRAEWEKLGVKFRVIKLKDQS
jgi:hypothetical protein